MSVERVAIPVPERVRSNWRGRRRIFVLLALLSVLGLIAALAQAALVEQGYRRFMLAYLTAFAFVLSLSLGALFFVILQHLTRAGWSVLVRRPAEVLAANTLVVAVLFVPIAISVLRGHGEIYPWARAFPAAPHGEAHAGPHHAGAATVEPGRAQLQPDPRLAAKRAYLNPLLFLARWAVLLAAWAGMGWYFWRRSVTQDQTHDVHQTVRLERRAGPALVLFGLTVTMGAFDLLMSLSPLWYSTIFGVYYFAGAVVGGLSVLILLVIGLQRAGALTRVIGESHYLDLGRLLFAFVFFWAYIAFSQYMLLWYANMPQSSSWFRVRGASTAPGAANAWSFVLLVLLFGHFLLPFAALMSRHVKRRPALLALGAAWLLLMHYLDLLWVVMPKMGPQLRLGAIEIGLLAAVGGVYLLAALHRLRRHSLVPMGDPRLAESAAHETVY